MDFYTLKGQSVGRHVVSLEHMILILRQPVSALSPQRCMISGKATNTNVRLWFYPTRTRTHELHLYHTLGEHANHYTTDVVESLLIETHHFFFFFYKKCTSETRVFLVYMTHQNVILQVYPVNSAETHVCIFFFLAYK